MKLWGTGFGFRLQISGVLDGHRMKAGVLVYKGFGFWVGFRVITGLVAESLEIRVVDIYSIKFQSTCTNWFAIIVSELAKDPRRSYGPEREDCPDTLFGAMISNPRILNEQSRPKWSPEQPKSESRRITRNHAKTLVFMVLRANITPNHAESHAPPPPAEN